jgi:glycerol transport system permease protein
MTRSGFSRAFLILFLVGSLLPIYWMLNMSLKTNEEILGSMTMWPAHLTFDNYITIFTDEAWYSGYINSMIYVAMNMVMAVLLDRGGARAFVIQRTARGMDSGRLHVGYSKRN